MEDFLKVAVIIIAIVLIATLLLQARGFGGGLLGGGSTSFRTRRGVEKTLFQFTIILGGSFVILSILAMCPSWWFGCS